MPETYPKHLSSRILLGLMGLAITVAIALIISMSVLVQQSVTRDTLNLLRRQSSVLIDQLNDEPDEAHQLELLRKLDVGDVRVTLIEPQGTVIFDNQADIAAMDNHAGRPEVAEALNDGDAQSTRVSTTEGMVSVYVAKRLARGDVLRLAFARPSMLSLLRQDTGFVVGSLLGIALLSFIASRLLARRLVRPILTLDPSNPQAQPPYAELEPLMRRLQEQHAELVQSMHELEATDRMRSEFTANVTHELKTPIASISGASEMIRDGIAAPQDVREFAGRIYDESQRLTALVNDILMLSRLDASERTRDAAIVGVVETVDLARITRSVAERLLPEAQQLGVELHISCEPAHIQGNPRLLDELVSNLVENALRYNHAGGEVEISLSTTSRKATLAVRDTGIGIPFEDQVNVFKRFYRVDKGRSRERGGTGLGLAIVKHAATFHHATLTLESTPGQGTIIEVSFPLIRAQL